MAKQYKNVYTILDKARKGELVTQSTGSLFKPMNMYKKPDVITPHLHYLDEKALFRNVSKFLTNSNRIDRYQQELSLKGIHKTSGDVRTALYDILHKFPKSLINDFFKLYHKDISELSFEDRTKDTQMRYQFIEKANQPLHKILTNGSNLKSLIYTEHVMEYFMKVMLFKKFANEPVDDVMDQMQQEEKACSVSSPGSGNGNGQGQQDNQDDSEEQDSPTSQTNSQPQSQQGQNDSDSEDDEESEDDEDSELQQPNASQNQGQAGQGGNSGAAKDGTDEHNSGTQPDIEKFMNDLMNGHDNQLEEILEKAMKACEEVNDVYSEQEQEELWEDMQNITGSGYDPDMIKNAADKIRNMQMNMNGIKSFIKHIMDKSKNYFSAAETTTYESLMETGNMDGVEDHYMLHPKLRKFMFEDIITKDIIKQGKINIYIDTSGSMDASCGARTEQGRYITRLDFAKSFAAKMKEMDMLNKIYVFDTSVKQRKGHLLDIINISSGGGTRIEAVIQHIIQTDENAIVITDADDRAHTYTPKAYFIGTEGASFYGFANLDKYHHQMCVFDGNTVRKVNSSGYAI